MCGEQSSSAGASENKNYESRPHVGLRRSESLLSLALSNPLLAGESWKQYNDVLQEMLSRVQSQLADVKQAIQEINWSRKDQQTRVGERLKQLESNWVGLVSKNYEIEQAVLTMEHEYNILKYEHDQRTETSSDQ